MSARAAGALLMCSVLVSTIVSCNSIQNVYGSPILFNSNRYVGQQANIIGFNNQNLPFPHSVNNFNPLSSSLVSSSQSTFRPGFSNIHPYLPSASFGRPLPINQLHGLSIPRFPADQTSGLSFQQGGSLNAGAITFGRPVHTPVSFPNKPTQSVKPSRPTNVPGVPISFGGGPVVFPGSSPSIVNKHIVTTGEATKPAGGASVTESNIPNINEDTNCMLKHGTIYFKGICEILLSHASCHEDDHWLLIDINGSPYCAKRQCPWGKLNYLTNCVDPGDHQVCKRGQMLYVDFTGLVECDCEPEFVFNYASGNCYGIHEQGFCDAAMYLERDNQGNIVCVPNPCISDEYVEQNRVCYEKNYRGHCPQNQVMILPQLVTADCLFIVPHNMLEVPKLSACPTGSQRDFFNQCRAVLRVPTQSSFPRSKGDYCPSDSVKDSLGACRKVITLFGG